jgi:hypothetical protein
MVVTEDEFLRWKEDEITKQFFKCLAMSRETMKENMILGLYETPEIVVGKGIVLKELLDMKYEEFQEASRND